MALADFFPEYRSLADSIQAGRNNAIANQDEARRQVLFEANQKQAELDLAQKQLALRGQLLSGIDTQDQYAQILPQIQRLGLPTNDLPTQQTHPSQAWQTFQRPEEGKSQLPQWAQDQFKPAQPGVPQWIPQEWAPKVGGQMLGYDVPQQEPKMNALPTDVLQGQGQYNLSGLPKAVDRGLTMPQQADAEAKRTGFGLREEEMRRLGIKDSLSAQWLDFQMRAKVAGMSQDQAEFAFKKWATSQGIGIDQARLGLETQKFDRETNTVKAGTENQGKSALLGKNVDTSFQTMTDVLKSGFDPTSYLGSIGVWAAGHGITRGFASSNAQEFNNAAQNISNALLRYLSGAAIADKERIAQLKDAIPALNDSPEVVQQKLTLIKNTIESMKASSGPLNWDDNRSLHVGNRVIGNQGGAPVPHFTLIPTTPAKNATPGSTNSAPKFRIH